jgi:type II secretory ATPase GspE/PulE/Tfp pilus assembly ATPase PilB-like protein/8-oxo-dGTP pyrophosphatase MutT (NUDIX family)
VSISGQIPTRDALAPKRDAWLAPLLREALSAEQLTELESALGERLWTVVVRRGWIAEDALLRAAAAMLRLRVADVSMVSAHALSLVNERWARRLQVLPLAATDAQIVLATADPCDVECERTLAFATGRTIEFALASPTALASAIDRAYRAEMAPMSPEPHVEVQHLSGDAESAPPSETDDSPTSITKLVDELLGSGISSRASDIHIEAEEQGIAVRHRVDGVLEVVRRLPRALGPALVSRIKIISGLDIADRLRPQDGRARIAVNGVAVDLRVSTLPASHGEKVVIRVLDSRSTVMTLDRMGFNPDELARIERLLEAREGLILVTGPTGSGKTTTLYAALRQLKQRGVNIVTVEDPIEYRLPGIVQVQVRERAGLTFAAALRSIMRQDPDVLLIGEIRDRETAEIAIQASLTGHLVLSTLHTNDAPSAVTRLIDIGVASYKIATAVKGVLAQRLVRRLCTTCGGHAGEIATHAASCASCGGSGFRGRLAVVEVLIASPEFERRVAAGEPTERIAAAARDGGMRSLWTSGLEHVARGETIIEELQRVASPDDSALDSTTSTDYLTRTVEMNSRRRASPRPSDFVAEPRVARLEIGTVDVYVIRPRPDGWKVLALQRALDTRCPSAWESVHGHLEPGEEPEDAALREVREETGLDVARLYNVTVQPFYLHATHTVMVAVVFAAFVDEPGTVSLGNEHQRSEWLDVDSALQRFHWPRERAALAEIRDLLSSGDAGPVEDVLRVPLE